MMPFVSISSLANKIQISKTTWLLLSMKGGYVLEERGLVEVKVSSGVNIIFKGINRKKNISKVIL